MVQYTIFKTITVIFYWKFIYLYEHQQETKVAFLAIFGTKIAKNKAKRMI